MINIYNFQIKSSFENLNTWVGFEKISPKYEWWIRLKDGKKFESSDKEWKDCLSHKFESGDIISLIVDGSNVSI